MIPLSILTPEKEADVEVVVEVDAVEVDDVVVEARVEDANGSRSMGTSVVGGDGEDGGGR